MPQLDITTFFSQLFFSSILFFIFYYNIISWIIPAFSSNLKLRKQKLRKSIIKQLEIKLSFILVNFFKNNIFTTYLINYKNIFVKLNNILLYNKKNIFNFFNILDKSLYINFFQKGIKLKFIGN